MRNPFVGDRAFYRRVAMVALPIIIQNAITNFVSLLDNIMVGQTNTWSMSGVSVVNQLLFIFNLCIFGAMSGAGIFSTQFHGSGDHQGVRRTFRFKLLAGLILGFGGVILFFLAGTGLIGLYIEPGAAPAEAAATLSYGLEYLHMMLIGLVPFALSNAYASTLRETGKTSVPMVAGIVAVLLNLVLNYIFIFGHLGLAPMGVRGAALATVISRFVELTIVAGWTHFNPKKNPFIVGVYRSLYIPLRLLKNIFLKGMPLLINEFLFALCFAMVNQCYSTRGLDVLAATNIASALINVCSIVYLSMGSTIGIILGQLMGAGTSKEGIQDHFRKMTALSVASCAIFSLLLFSLSVPFPLLFNTSAQVRGLATRLICVFAVLMPVNAYVHAVYFAMRSGGKTLITFFFDCGFSWLVTLPLAFLLSRFTAVPILPLYAVCTGFDIFKAILGYFMIHKVSWIQNLTLADKS